MKKDVDIKMKLKYYLRYWCRDSYNYNCFHLVINLINKITQENITNENQNESKDNLEEHRKILKFLG